MVAALLVVAAALTIGVVHVGATVARRAAAQAAADAAALAGAADGRPAAEEVAAANGATVTGYRVEELDVVVTVRRSGIAASARARWSAATSRSQGADGASSTDGRAPGPIP